jgi:hypothetical protein
MGAGSNSRKWIMGLWSIEYREENHSIIAKYYMTIYPEDRKNKTTTLLFTS